jgi:hypothetical protein
MKDVKEQSAAPLVVVCLGATAKVAKEVRR